MRKISPAAAQVRRAPLRGGGRGGGGARPGWDAAAARLAAGGDAFAYCTAPVYLTSRTKQTGAVCT